MRGRLLLACHIVLLVGGASMAAHGWYDDSWRWFLAGCLVMWEGWR